MGDFTYAPPDERTFLHTMKVALEQRGDEATASLLRNTRLSFETCGTFARRGRWNAYAATVALFVEPEKLSRFTDVVKDDLSSLADSIMPPEVGYDITNVRVAPFLQAPPEDDTSPLNQGVLGKTRTYEHDGLNFRSKTEIRIYDVLKRRKVLFFVNSAGVLGGRGEKREPDFLICQGGKWGILEVMGEQYHPAATAMKDHDRARLFKDYGLVCIEFYDAHRCYETPDQVVDEFLALLGRS